MTDYKPAKTKKTQPKTESEVQGRDAMYTPNYGVDVIGKFIPTDKVWEMCAGDGRFARRLETRWNKEVYKTEINGNFEYWNFIEGRNTKVAGEKYSIVTNPPFSLKEEMFRKCLEYGLPFALLIPLDYSSWLIEAIEKYNCEKLIPKRRISYLTPNVLYRVHAGEVWNIVKGNFTQKKYSEVSGDLWKEILFEYKDTHNYKRIDDVPNNLLAKYSSADFHSGYLTWGFGFGKSETFVDLPISEMKNNIV